jgi:hypothetical protein
VKLIVHFHGASFLGLDIGPYQDLHKQIRSVFDLLCVDQHDLEPCLRHIYQILTTTHPSLSSDFKQIIGVDRRNDEILINDWLLAWNQQKHRVTVPTTNLYHLLCGFRASSLALVTGLWHTRVALAHKDRETVLDNLPLSQEYPNPGLHL